MDVPPVHLPTLSTPYERWCEVNDRNPRSAWSETLYGLSLTASAAAA